MPRFLGLTAVASLTSAAVAFLFGDVGVSAVMAVAAAGIVIVAPRLPRFLSLTAVASLMSAAVAFLFGDVGVSAVMAVAAAGIVIVAAAAHCEYPPRATRWGSETDAEMIARSFEDGEPHIADPRRDKLAEELLESFETLEIIAAAAVMHAQAKGHDEHEMEEVVNFISTLDYDGLAKLRELATEMKGKGGGRRRGGPR